MRNANLSTIEDFCVVRKRENFYSMCLDVDLFHRNVYECVNLLPFALLGQTAWQAEGKLRACESLNEMTNQKI